MSLHLRQRTARVIEEGENLGRIHEPSPLCHWQGVPDELMSDDMGEDVIVMCID